MTAGFGVLSNETAEAIELAADRPGFLGVESASEDSGVGITVSYWADEDAIAAALEVVSGCGCEAGCPSCIGPVDPEDIAAADINRKEVILGFLKSWRGDA